jgi:hypothetical protein
MKQILLAAITSLALLTSCKKDNEQIGKTYTGPEQTFQHGKAWTWVQLGDDQNPKRLAIAIDEAAMNSLDPGDSHNSGHNHTNAVSLQFHPDVNIGPFNHAFLDWNPHGHMPDGLYDKPHFDFHFYMISEANRLQIPPFEVDSSKFKIYPAQGLIPQQYIPIPGGVPQMGVHWADVTSPELNGQPFTQTFLYGSYDGQVAFYEPMITLDFIKANPSYQRNIPVPARFAKTGYYPTKIRIQKVNGITNIILEDFVYRQAS